MSLFHRVMTIFYKSGILLQFWNLRIDSQPTLKFKLSDWLKNDSKELILDFGRLGRDILQMFELVILKILVQMPFSVS